MRVGTSDEEWSRGAGTFHESLPWQRTHCFTPPGIAGNFTSPYWLNEPPLPITAYVAAFSSSSPMWILWSIWRNSIATPGVRAVGFVVPDWIGVSHRGLSSLPLMLWHVRQASTPRRPPPWKKMSLWHV